MSDLEYDTNKVSADRGLAGNVVEVLVGHDKTEFKVHKDVLCRKSEFFRAAFEGHFKESKENRLELDDTTTEAFKRFLLWCYSDRIFEPDQPLTALKLGIFVELYRLADFVGCPDLQDLTLSSLAKSFLAFVDIEEAYLPAMVYESTEAGSPLGRLVVDIWVGRCNLSSLADIPQEDKLEAYPQPFLLDFISAFHRRHILKEGKCSDEISMCDYHVHGPREDCPYQGTLNFNVMHVAVPL